MTLKRLVKRYYKMLDKLHRSNAEVPVAQLIREVASHMTPIDRRELFKLVEANTWLAELRPTVDKNRPVEGIIQNLYSHLVALGENHLRKK